MSVKMKDLPMEERPREKLIKNGVSSLSDAEVLSIILKNGTRGVNVRDLASLMLSKFGGFSGFRDLSYLEMVSVFGIGLAKACEVIAMVEAGKRIFIRDNGNSNGISMKCAQDIYNSNRHLFLDKKQEYFYCLYLNNRKELIERKLLFMGTINRSVVHPREIFKEAYLVSASSIVCMHNHPGGDVMPSREDIYFTDNLMKIGMMQGIPVVDHIIFSDGGYYSFYENSGKI